MSNAYNISDFCNHLFNDDLDGYVSVVQLKNSKMKSNSYNSLDDIQIAANDFIEKPNCYITPNPSYNHFRRSSNVRQLRSLYIDLDNKRKIADKNLWLQELYNKVFENKIPSPTMITDSGRGFHIYWSIEHAPKQALSLWQEIEDYLYYQLKEIGADPKATDCCRVLRLPQTLNTSSNTLTNVIFINDDIKYSLYELRDKYLYSFYNTNKKHYYNTNKDKNKKNISNKNKSINLFNSYTLHMNRSLDLLTICKIRNYDVTGYRNMILHCYAYWQGIYTRDEEELKNLVVKLNNKFTKPLKDTEVNSILRCIPKAIKKFLEYEQGRRDNKEKRVSKVMKIRGGYWYKNSTLIERLDITLLEQQQLKTIISTGEKYKRNNERRKKLRRNEEGLTQREVKKLSTKEQIQELKLKKLTQKEIAKLLNINIRTVKRNWN